MRYLPILFVLFSAFSILYWSVRNGISPMPTSPKVRKKLMGIPLKLRSGVIYELGSGWGTLAFAYAKKYPSLQVKAYETSWIPYAFCRFRQFFFPQPNLEFLCEDFFSIPLKNATLVICYLYRQAMDRLKIKFDEELLENCIVITHTFKIYGRNPEQAFVVNDLYQTMIYLYRWP